MRSHRLPICLLVLAVLAVAAPAAGAKTFGWLCKPGLKSNPCGGSLSASVVDASGAVLRTEKTKVPAKHAVDCFYVYPTVSSQPTVNADLKIDPEQIAIAKYQASRFSQNCTIYAPVYKQLTIAGIFDPKNVTPENQAIAYAGVRDSWREYMRKYNKGRGVILLGHSQGSFQLRQLIKSEIDTKPAVRRRLVSALLLGGNVAVLKGKDIGGDFKNIPGCHKATETGCVIAYSMFNATPPEDSRFGRVSSGFGGSADAAAKYEVLCTNPAALGGGKGKLKAYDYTTPFPGTLGVAVNAFVGELPDVPTPWLIPNGTYTAECSTAGGADFLHVVAGDGARDFAPSPDAGWGWHLGDVNLAQGNLTAIVAKQIKAYSSGGYR
jgi:hypothetical protein